MAAEPLLLAHFLGNSPQFCRNLPTIYDLRVAEKKAGTTIRSLPPTVVRMSTDDGALQRTR